MPAAQMGGQPAVVSKIVKPGETFDFNVNLIAPIYPGIYQGFWQMQNLAKQHFGETVWVGITVPGIVFTANPTSITASQSTLFQWSTSNVQAVYFYHDGQDWQNHGVVGGGQSTEYLPQTMNYYLRVVLPNDEVQVRTIMIYINPAASAPVIDDLSASPVSVLADQCANVSWSVSGQADRVALLINNNAVWDYAPISGNYQDCPGAAGTQVYTLQAFGPGGTSAQQTAVNVQANPQPQPTATPVPPVINGFTLAAAPRACSCCATMLSSGTARR